MDSVTMAAMKRELYVAKQEHEEIMEEFHDREERLSKFFTEAEDAAASKEDFNDWLMAEILNAGAKIELGPGRISVIGNE